MKQTLAISLAGLQGLGSDDYRERPVDRIGAVAMISRRVEQAPEALRQSQLAALGVDLVAFKFGNRAPSHKDAVDMLSAYLAWPQFRLGLKAKRLHQVASWAITEWSIDMCPSCQGAKEVPNGEAREGAQPMKPCMDCGSTGKRRYSDAERATALAGEFDKALAVAHGLIGRAEDLAVRGAAQMLERWK